MKKKHTHTPDLYIQESLESLIRAQIRVLESQLFNKSTELQEDISMKKFDLQTKRLHLAAIRAQVSVLRYKRRCKKPRSYSFV